MPVLNTEGVMRTFVGHKTARFATLMAQLVDAVDLS
jgi:hypothetical protein